MKTIEKLAKKDKSNLVTKKDGSLNKYAISAINNSFSCRFFTHYTSGAGRFTINLSNTRALDIIKLLGYKYTEGNDSPRGGKTGNYIKVSKIAFNNIKNLLK